MKAEHGWGKVLENPRRRLPAGCLTAGCSLGPKRLASFQYWFRRGQSLQPNLDPGQFSQVHSAEWITFGGSSICIIHIRARQNCSPCTLVITRSTHLYFTCKYVASQKESEGEMEMALSDASLCRSVCLCKQKQASPRQRQYSGSWKQNDTRCL